MAYCLLCLICFLCGGLSSRELSTGPQPLRQNTRAHLEERILRRFEMKGGRAVPLWLARLVLDGLTCPSGGPSSRFCFCLLCLYTLAFRVFCLAIVLVVLFWFLCSCLFCLFCFACCCWWRCSSTSSSFSMLLLVDVVHFVLVAFVFCCAHLFCFLFLSPSKSFPCPAKATRASWGFAARLQESIFSNRTDLDTF